MGITVIVGGQFGSEGKGKVAHYFAREKNALVAIRVGGSNSGHTVIDDDGNPVILRILPTAAILPNIICILGAGSYINVDLLLEEVSLTGLSEDKLMIDPNAMIVSEQDVEEEKNSGLRGLIGSTLSGTGSAVRRRITRQSTTILAKDEERIKQFVKPVIPFLRGCLEAKERIIIEGTQGFGLSLLHTPFYPKATSRDTTASAFVSEAGLSPLDVDEVVMVIRAFPIRVPGNSGPLPNEIDWDTVTAESGSTTPIIEYTSVTKVVRRVARFDPEIVLKAIVVNNPTCIVLNHLDYVEAHHKYNDNNKALPFSKNIEHMIGRQIDYFGFGPRVLFDRTLVLR